MAATGAVYVAGMGNWLFALYLVIAANYLGNLFSCRIQNLLVESHYIRHVMGFITLYVTAVVTGTYDSLPQAEANPGVRLGLAVVVYLWFLFTARMDHRLFAGTITALLVAFSLQLAKEKEPDPPPEGRKAPTTNDILSYVQAALVSLAMVVTMVGVVIYVRAKQEEYNKTAAGFSWTEFLVGQSKCKHNGDGTVEEMNSCIQATNACAGGGGWW